MSESQFLDELYDLIGEYTQNNSQYEDITAGQYINYSNGEDFCVTIEISKVN